MTGAIPINLARQPCKNATLVIVHRVEYRPSEIRIVIVAMCHLPPAGRRQIGLQRRSRRLLGGFCRLAGNRRGSKPYEEPLRATRVDWQATIRSLGCAEGRYGPLLSTGRQQRDHTHGIVEEAARRARNERPGRAGRSEVTCELSDGRGPSHGGRVVC